MLYEDADGNLYNLNKFVNFFVKDCSYSARGIGGRIVEKHI